MTNGRGDPNNATLFINLDCSARRSSFNQMGYGAAIAWLLFVARAGPDARALRPRPGPGLLRRWRAMTASLDDDIGDARSGDRGPVARSYRRFLAKASITMFALHHPRRLPAAAAVHGHDRVPAAGQASTPGAAGYPAEPLTGDLPGPDVPDVHRPDRRHHAQADADREGPRVEHVRRSRPTRPRRRSSGQGRWRTLQQAWTVRAADRELHDRLERSSNFPRLLRNTVGDRRAQHARRPCRRRRWSPTASPGSASRQEHPVHHPDRDDHPAVPGHAVPTYVIFTRLGWNGTWLPLIVPHFFANAYNVFLLRQYFMSIPRDLDEAAMIDGAGPFRILRSVIVPLSVAGDHRGRRCSTSSSPGTTSSCRCCTSPASPSSSRCRSASSSTTRSTRPQPTLIQAAALMTMAVPVVVFFLAQRAFMRGVVVTGVEK